MGKMILNGKEYVGGENWHKYSTSERIIGEWIDGKPLYERTLIYQNASASSSSEYSIDISTDISNIDACINFEAIFVETNKKLLCL